MTTPLLAFDSMARSFGSRRVLHSASVWVYPRRITVLIGRNGCGKSTLLKCGLGLRRAERGVVQYLGRRTLRPSLARMAREGLFFWPDQALLPYGRRLDLLGAVLRHHVPSADFEQAAAECAVDGLLRHQSHELSGGERRRAELALVLARRPRVLLADEPFLGVMPADRGVFADGLRSVADRGGGVLITGHEVDTLFELADDVVWMTAGTTHHLGAPAEAREHRQFQREYLAAH